MDFLFCIRLSWHGIVDLYASVVFVEGFFPFKFYLLINAFYLLRYNWIMMDWIVLIVNKH